MEPLNAVVLQRADVGPGLMTLQVAPIDWTIPDFKPGQYTTIGLPGSYPRWDAALPEKEPIKSDEILKRAYSIASAPHCKEYLEFYVALVDDGALTPRLWCLQPGDRLFMSPRIVGTFTLDKVPPDKNLVLIATGTGLAPFMAMLHQSYDFGAPRKTAVLHGVRHSHALGYRSELIALQHLSRNFLYLPVISRPKNEPVPWTGPSGYVQQVWQSGVIEQAWGTKPAPGDTHVMICGNPAMIDQLTGVLGQEGFSEHHHRKNPEGQIHLEKYW